jgi:hypothetical protein
MPLTGVHHVATKRSVRINQILWVLMLCCLVASVTVIILQQGLIHTLVIDANGPATPPGVIRLNRDGIDLICILQPGSTKEAPNYHCSREE